MNFRLDQLAPFAETNSTRLELFDAFYLGSICPDTTRRENNKKRACTSDGDMNPRWGAEFLMELLNTLTRRHRFAYFFLKLRAFNGVLTLEELGSKQAHLVTSKFQTYNLPARASYSRVNTDLVCRVLRSLILSPGVSSADKVQFQQRSYA